jgi:hypothetical protein
LGKPLKILRTKLKILELHQNKHENPQHYFPPFETSKMTRGKLKISNFQNMKTKKFQNSHEKGTYHVSSLVKISHTKFEDPLK